MNFNKKYEIKITSAATKFHHVVKGHTSNREIRQEFQIFAIHDKITYKQNWKRTF
jgi:hypothetical protein